MLFDERFVTEFDSILSISSKGEKLLLLSDTIIHPLHLIEIEWYSMVDILPERVALTRRKILQPAAAKRTLVMAFHFPFPGLGRVVPGEQAWKWQPFPAAAAMTSLL